MDRLFLDNEELELGGETGIYLTYRSNIFSDITKIVGDNSATIHVPATNHNKAVVECSMIPSADSLYPYRTHTARLERDGIVMIKDATAVLMSVTTDTIELALTWGVTNALQAWVNGDLSLRDLQFSYFTWDANTIANRAAYFPHANYGFAPSDNTIGRHPVEYVGSILAKIASDNGLTFVYGEDPWEDDFWVVPLLTRNDYEGAAWDWEMYCGYQGTDDTWAIGYLYANPNLFSNDVHWKSYWSVAYYPNDDLATAKTAEGDTPDTGDSNLKKTNWLTIHNNIKVTISGTANVRVVSATDIDAWNTTLRVVGWCNTSDTSWAPEDVITDGETLLTLSPDSQTATLYGSEWRYDMGFTFNDVELDLTSIETGMTYQHLYFVAESNNGSEVKHGHTLNGSISYKFVQDPIDFGRNYYITPNLPDIKQIDFVKAIMQMSGLFAFLNSSGSITFAPYSILNTNKIYARDWSQYLLHNGLTIPNEMQYHQGDECQHNKMHYHNPDAFPDWSGDYQIDNETLEYERDAVTLPFDAYNTDGGVANFPIYHYEREEVNGVETNVLKYEPDTDAHVARVVNVGNPLLPEEYTQLEYIESTGTQYIDTGVVPADNIGFSITLKLNTTPSNQAIFGAREGTNRLFVGARLSTDIVYYGFAGDINVNSGVVWENASPTNKNTIEVNLNNSRVALLNGSQSRSLNTLNHVFSSSTTLAIFGCNSSGSVTIYPQKVYGCQISQGTTLIHDLIPCKRNADNLTGMYDLVSGTLFANAGTGAFTMGAAVNTGKYQLRNTGLTWTELLSAHYTDYIGMLNHARVLTERFILPPMELRDIDLRIPIYLEQYGSYFAISTIKTKANNEAEVELIKMS